MQKKIVIALSAILIFLSVAYISYYIASSSSSDPTTNNTASNLNDVKSDTSNSNANGIENSTAPKNNNKKPSKSNTKAPSDTSTPNMGTEEVEFIKKGTVKSPVFTHPQPVTNSEVLRTLNKDESVNIIAQYQGWYKLDDNTYVYSSFVNIDN